ncbi:MAG: glycerol kinase GlpK [Defluviitaleaceae bacterium]|nr:glycerol kinase GlpK [Defluviitaleaceae bacterium]
MARYLMSLDAGTTSSRCIIFDFNGNKIAMAQKEHKQIFPNPSLVEHDPMEIWENQLDVVKKALYNAKLSASDIATIGITNQRETVIVWDKSTGKPIYNAIVWQCRRTADFCDALKQEGYDTTIREKTGLTTDAYFSGTKLRWLLENIDGAKEAASRGDLLFGTVDTWLLWQLTKGAVFATDYSNASRTMLYNIHELKWDDEILAEFNIPKCILPEVLPSAHIFGHAHADFFGAEIPISGIAGDQQAALFGQGCFELGMVKNTYGTGCFMLMNTGNAAESKNGLLTTIAWGIGDNIEYALEGSVFVAGSVVQWLRDSLGLIKTASETCGLAKSVDDTGGIYIVPAFTGLGAPHWLSHARGIISGITHATRKEHIVRAALEAIAYQSHDVISAMVADTGISLTEIRVDGGASANDFLMQFQADISGVAVRRPQQIESTALGAALLAGLGIGLFENKDEVAKKICHGSIFTPHMDSAMKAQLLDGWNMTINAMIF